MQRTVFLTGGARGIGAAMRQRFAAAGARVIAPTREEMELASPSSIREYFAAYAPLSIDVLINNAAENRVSPLEELPVDAWERMIAINLTAPLLLLQQVIPGMRANGWGRIVNISSCYSIVSRPGRGAYSTTKSGLNGLTRTAALENAPYNILVNAVCPGFVETDLTKQNNSPEQIQRLCEQVPLGRLAGPEEIANFVYFLCSEENSYITGQMLVIDGGFTCQ